MVVSAFRSMLSIEQRHASKLSQAIEVVLENRSGRENPASGGVYDGLQQELSSANENVVMYAAEIAIARK